MLTEYNPKWSEWFRDEKTSIENIIGKENIESVRHIGSTLVAGLIAKPTVDILVGIKNKTDLEKLKVGFPQSKYVCLSKQTVPTDASIL